MSNNTAKTKFVLDEDAFYGGFKSAMEDFCCELLWDCSIDGWVLNESEVDAIRQALIIARADAHDTVSDVIANQFRIDAHTKRLIDKGYCLNVGHKFWVADAGHVVTVLTREGASVTNTQEAFDKGLAVWESPFPTNPRYTW